MADVVIRAENLCKLYRIGQREKRSDTLAEALFSAVKSPFKNFKQIRRLTRFDSTENGDDVLWVLRDVSFEVRQGEVLGIIGRNGAGKSTLLKILSRITEPTKGRALVKGRVGSLLEVGTGFHPELTGRENIYMNGTILGMTKAEIDKKFDEIVDFSGVEKFLDTPVKRYSSGMKVRLAFAVAAHLDTDVLIIDEVLAVGDAQFQKKCLGKMDSLIGSLRTILFVSHNLTALRNLCSRSLVLDAGQIVYSGATDDAVKFYLKQVMKQNGLKGTGTWERTEPGAGVRKVEFIQNGVVTDTLEANTPFQVNIWLDLDDTCHHLEIGVGLIDEDGFDIFRVNNKHLDQKIAWAEKKNQPVTVHVPGVNWVYGEWVYLGVYFGYVGRNYQELPSIIKLKLKNQFEISPVLQKIRHENRIFIEGLRFV